MSEMASCEKKLKKGKKKRRETCQTPSLEKNPEEEEEPQNLTQESHNAAEIVLKDLIDQTVQLRYAPSADRNVKVEQHESIIHDISTLQNLNKLESIVEEEDVNTNLDHNSTQAIPVETDALNLPDHYDPTPTPQNPLCSNAQVFMTGFLDLGTYMSESTLKNKRMTADLFTNYYLAY